MKPDAEGLTRIDRVRHVITREIIDGCNDCHGAACDKHLDLIQGMRVTPLKYIDMKTRKLKPEYEAKL